MLNYKPKNFKLWELVDPDTYNRFGNKAWKFLDARAVEMLQRIRSELGPCVVNTWHSQGMIKKYGYRSQSGFRPSHSVTGGFYSQHRFGRAFDLIPLESSVTAVREYIILNPELYPYITRLEHGDYADTWVHFDIALTNKDKVHIFKP